MPSSRAALYDVTLERSYRGIEAPRTMDNQSLDDTAELVERVKTGDVDALNSLIARFLPALRPRASGRLPRWSRDLMDTDDLVQETVLRAVNRVGSFESRH